MHLFDQTHFFLKKNFFHDKKLIGKENRRGKSELRQSIKDSTYGLVPATAWYNICI